MDFPEWRPAQFDEEAPLELLEDEDNEDFTQYHFEKDAILFVIDAHSYMFENIFKKAKLAQETIRSESTHEIAIKVEDVTEQRSIKEEIIKDERMTQQSSIDPENTKEENKDDLKYELKSRVQPQNSFCMGLKAVVQAACDKIISSPSDLIGVVFYGTKEKQNVFDFDNIYVYQSLDIPEANRIKDLENMIKSGKSPFGYCDENGELADISKVLWTCQNLFSNVPSNVGSRRVFLFTSEEDPSRGNQNIRNQSIERASTLVESDIVLDVFAFRKNSHTLNASKFWNHIISGDFEEYNDKNAIHFIDNVDDLRSTIKRKEFKKRSLGSLNMSIGKMDIAVNWYNLLQRAKKNPYIRLHAETNKRVISEIRQICEDTGSELMPYEIVKRYDYGGKKISFTNDELKAIRDIVPVGIHILGFKSLSRLKPYHTVGSLGFLYPNDFQIKNSSVAFSSLLTKMLEKKVFAVARIRRREIGTYSYAALIPQKEIMNEDEIQMEPPGLHVIMLPFADNIRSYDFPHRPVEVSDEQLEAFQNVVRKVRFDFTSSNFENPVIQQHYAALQALALEHSEAEPVKDYVQPDYEGMKVYRPLMEAARKLVYTENYNPFQGKSEKRKRENNGDSQKNSKRVKYEEIDMVAEVKNRTISKLAKPILELFLEQQGLSTKGLKNELIERIENYLKDRNKI